MDAYNTSAVNVSGGVISYYLDANNSSVVNISGGNFSRFLTGYDIGVININGGAFYYVDARNNSIINIRGGAISNQLDAEQNGIINFFGSGLASSLINPNASGYSQYDITGALQDGTPLNENLFLKNGNSASFTLNTVGGGAVPEPGSVALLVGMATVGAGVLRRRRK